MALGLGRALYALRCGGFVGRGQGQAFAAQFATRGVDAALEAN